MEGPDVPRASSYSRRHIRALATGTRTEAASDTPEPVVWSRQKVAQMAVDVLIDPPLYSTASPYQDPQAPTPSTPAEAEAVIQRACAILDELASGTPYGKILGFQTGLWVQTWSRVAGETPVVIERRWIGTTQHEHCAQTVVETRSMLLDLLGQGLNSGVVLRMGRKKESPGFRKRGHQSKTVFHWLEISKIAVRWICNPDDAPKDKPKQPKQKQPKQPKQPRKSKQPKPGKQPRKKPGKPPKAPPKQPRQPGKVKPKQQRQKQRPAPSRRARGRTRGGKK